MSVTLAVLLWPVEGCEAELHAYEDDVLRLLGEHRGRVVSRARSVDADGSQPLETQLISFDDDAGFDAYMGDPRRTAMTDRRDACVARTQLWRVDLD
ncbi:DUF1330 domain-containing protein [Gordonia sp. OPL2]|uniref:DUF1330 domain-containing protein n=1 Tax=Gordonia sp. OPL2 TaxID=2486274 RepID=UPI0016563F63|nr:DUF1330 domain-containing protein [Gordonia sp. OPL2]ROZ98509.1 DUF1330 domain-containing protein [Gordonia sp. OPL2]